MAYYAVKYIERTGHWTLSEDVDISTKVQIRLERGELYDLEFPDTRMGAILELLMRKHTGVFSYPVPVDEEYMASKIDVTVPMLRQLLYKLSLEHVIRYVPCDHATVLYLHHERLRPKNVNLDPERYEFLKKSSSDRIQKMIDYLNEEDVCRSSYLLDYFGQHDSKNCGTCDVCRSVSVSSSAYSAASGVAIQDNPRVASLEDDIRNFIIVELGGAYTLDQVSIRFGSATISRSDVYLKILRRMIDDGSVPPPQIF